MMANDKPKELRKDLETIKDLLDEETKQAPLEDVPVLDDTIEVESAKRGLSEAKFKTLLGDAWQESVKDLFDDRTIELPDDVDALSEVLKLRIDKSVREWLEETLQANIATLRERMVHELSEELLLHLRRRSRNASDKD